MSLLESEELYNLLIFYNLDKLYSGGARTTLMGFYSLATLV